VRRTLYVGCPMWAQRAWVGRFLPVDTPSGRELHAYCRLLNAVEGNTTFYATPTPEIVARWRDQALPGFRFVFKVPKHITHDRRLRGIATELTAFCQLMGTDWHSRPEFATNAGRLTHLKQLRPLLREKLAPWQVAQLGQALDAQGISWGNINDLEQVFAHPQVQHRQMLQAVEHPQLGALRLVRNPMVPPGRDAQITPPPVLGPAALPEAHHYAKQET